MWWLSKHLSSVQYTKSARGFCFFLSRKKKRMTILRIQILRRERWPNLRRMKKSGREKKAEEKHIQSCGSHYNSIWTAEYILYIYTLVLKIQLRIWRVFSDEESNFEDFGFSFEKIGWCRSGHWYRYPVIIERILIFFSR